MITCVKDIGWDTKFKIVYFNENGYITSFENRIDEKSTNEFEYFLLSDVENFLNNKWNIKDYNVVFQKDTLRYAIKRNPKKTFVAMHNTSNLITQISDISDNPDIIITLTNTGFTIHATAKLKQFFVTDQSTEVTIMRSNTHKFYITLKDCPDFLLDTVEIRFADILSGKEITINYEHKYNISIYTNQIFELYSLGDNTR
tara:strand:+ start:4962 stop:5561 length:600 start_codon:yes stop_codon:yes gene_type:complete